MATFPALEPATRSYTMGRYPIAAQPAFAAEPVRFLQAATSIGYQLKLGYAYLTAAEAKLIRDHWREQAGGLEPFLLSSQVMINHGGPNIITATKRWRYIGAPQEQQLTGGLVNVSLELETVEGTFALGAAVGITVAIAAGLASAEGPAMALTVTVSLALGSAEAPDHRAPGADLAITAALVAGAAGAPPLTITVTVSITAGAASASVPAMARIITASLATGAARAI